MIDTFQDPRPAKALLDEIRKLTPLPMRFVVNTHYHLDHVNGNDVFAAVGATIVAHRGGARLDAHREHQDAGSSGDAGEEGARRNR